MLRKVGNQAYRWLSDHLSLAGADNLASIDIGQAFATHQLNQLVKRDLIYNVIGVVQVVVPNATNDSLTLRLWEDDFDSIYEVRGASPVGRTYHQWENPAEWDYVIRGMSYSSGAGTLSFDLEMRFLLSLYTGQAGTQVRPLTGNLQYWADGTPAGGQNADPQGQNLPHLILPAIHTPYLMVRNGTAQQQEGYAMVEYTVAPPGILNVPGPDGW